MTTVLRSPMVRRPPRLAALALLALAGCGARSDLAALEPPSASPASSIVLFGGNGLSTDDGDTWVWAPATGWTEAQPGAMPTPRNSAAAASLGGEVVLFGGDTMTAETWVYRGSTWEQRQPAEPPPVLTDSLMVDLGQTIALFGGYHYGTLYHDVWLWDGTSWAHQSPPMVPPAREAPSGAVLGGSLVVFGGEGVNLLPLGDTWLYDGSAWTQLQPAHAPEARRGAVAAVLDGRIVLFGGDTIPEPYGDWVSSSETWVWDGTDWTEQHPPVSPPARSFAGMAAVGDRIVLFGGYTFAGADPLPAGTWTWDGTIWTEQPGPDPSPRNGPAMTAR